MAGVAFRGILFYPGHIRVAGDGVGSRVRELAARLAPVFEALRAKDLEPEIVSGGSTPTLWHSHLVPGLTEIRSGSCIFFDREGLTLGVARREHLAYTVLATVISTSVPGRAVVDAGSKALAKESRGGDGGFGVLLDRPEVTVAAISEEHGVLDLSGSAWAPAIGERVRIVPNHVCVSVNLQDRLLGADAGGFRPIPIEARGRGPVA